jgi:hypothetical protein
MSNSKILSMELIYSLAVFVSSFYFMGFYVSIIHAALLHYKAKLQVCITLRFRSFFCLLFLGID